MKIIKRRKRVPSRKGGKVDWDLDIAKYGEIGKGEK